MNILGEVDIAVLANYGNTVVVHLQSGLGDFDTARAKGCR